MPTSSGNAPRAYCTHSRARALRGREAQLVARAAAYVPQVTSDDVRLVPAVAPWSTALLRVARATAVTVGRTVVVRPEALSDSVACVALLVHELTHVAQYQRLGRAGLLWHYAWQYVGMRCRGATHHAAYRGISFEREAETAAAAALTVEAAESGASGR